MSSTLTPTIGLEQAAQLLRCHPDTVRKMAKAGELPGTKVGRAWVFYTERLLQWLDARCVGARTDHKDAPSSGSALARRLAAQRERKRPPR